MSDRPIQVGDLVMVVKPTPCCGNEKAIGDIHVVLEPVGLAPNTRCIYCNLLGPHIDTVKIAERLVIERYRLKRIPPLEELEGQRTEESTRDPVHNFERHFKNNRLMA